MWLSSSRVVIGHCFSGNGAQYFCTGASRSSLPESARVIAAAAEIGFAIEPVRINVSVVAGIPFSRSAAPNARE